MTKANFSNGLNEDDFNWKMTSNGRLSQLLKVEYLSNYWSDISQILNLSLYDQSKLIIFFSNEDDSKWKMTSNGRLPNKLNMEYLSNYWSNISQILNLSVYYLSKLFKYFKKQFQMEDYLKH